MRSSQGVFPSKNNNQNGRVKGLLARDMEWNEELREMMT
jgi:hypothetical protein